MEYLYQRPKVIFENAVSGFCPGCIHATVHKLIAEELESLGLVDKCIRVAGIGCCGNGNKYLDLDYICAPHGRACAVATGIKRSNPDKFVFTYQGDGDLASIGLAETVSAAARGENFSVIFLNNSTYGMTGGQLAPTTLMGQKATTAPMGRCAELHGYPLHMVELLNTLKAPAFLTRVSCSSPANIRKTRAAIRKAFTNQLEGKGFSLVEILMNCPTDWKMSPLDSLAFIDSHTSVEFPLGELRSL